MINPFVTNGYAGTEYFCDRVQETEDIVGLLRNGNNLALISPRRYGKTDLVRHCFDQEEIKNRYYTFIIDIYSTKSLAEMVNKMGKTILETLKPKGRKVWERFLDMAHSLRPGVTYDGAGLPSLTLSVGDIVNPNNTLDEIFHYLQKVMNVLFMRTPEGGHCDVAGLEPAIDYIVDFTSLIYEDLMYQLPEKKSLVLRAICEDGKVSQITSGKFSKNPGWFPRVL